MNYLRQLCRHEEKPDLQSGQLVEKPRVFLQAFFVQFVRANTTRFPRTNAR
ncbi:hypothetical protein JOD44_001459, partial [Salimicrobium jeotgali]|nr:hypothetical protein [Salimicrobium jeotgali]